MVSHAAASEAESVGVEGHISNDDDTAGSMSLRIIGISPLNRRIAVLIQTFSHRSDLALAWVRLQQLRQYKWRQGVALHYTAEHLGAWAAEFTSDSLVKRCVDNPSTALSGTVREFLVESLLAEKVRNLSSLGLVVPSGFVVDSFLRMLNVLPANPVIRDRIKSLTTSASSCKKWCRRFRETWHLQWGETSVPHGVSPAAARTRAAVYLGWLQYWFQHFGAEREVVVVNMDETMLGAVKQAKAGVTDGASGVAGGCRAAPAREAALQRTSLIATICSDPAVQKCLPQIRLPRTASGKVPSKPMLDNYAAAGPPQITWHGSAGFASSRILQWYLTRLTKAVRCAKPGVAILLVWDCCPVHLCEKVLQTARRLRLGVVIVPGRMTWALQPLDTHVFAVLKNNIRAKIFEAKAKEVRSALPPGVRIRIHGDAIRETLVERSWEGAMQKTGLCRDLSTLRQALKELLGGAGTAAAFPSVPDMMELLSVNETRATELRRILTPQMPLGSRLPAGPGEAGLPVVVPLAGAPPRVFAEPRPVILSSRARLPSAPGGQRHPDNVWMPFFAGRSVQTRSMTAAAAPAAAPAPAGTARAPAVKRARTSDF